MKRFYRSAALLLAVLMAAQPVTTAFAGNKTEYIQELNEPLKVSGKEQSSPSDAKKKEAISGESVKAAFINSGEIRHTDRYTISFDSNGGSKIASVTQDYNTKVAAPEDPVKKGYTFAGWNPEIPERMPAENITLKAKWTANRYKISFNANGGTGTMSPLTGIAFGSVRTLTANAYKKTGYTFTGWNTGRDGKGTVYADKATIKNLSAGNGATVTLYAQWKAEKYTISYCLNGGKNSSGNPAYYYVTSATITLKKPTRTGYIFRGWYSDSSFKTRVKTITGGTTGNRKLYAKWASKTEAAIKFEDEISLENGVYVLPRTGQFSLKMVNIDITKDMEVHSSNTSVARAVLNDFIKRDRGKYYQICLYAYKKGTVRVWLTEPGKTKVIAETTIVVPDRTEVIIDSYAADTEGKKLACFDVFGIENIALDDLTYSFKSDTVKVTTYAGYNGDGLLRLVITGLIGTGEVNMTVSSKSQPKLKYQKTFSAVN